MKNRIRLLMRLCAVPIVVALCVAAYVGSVVVRVSVAENQCLGRSMLMPVRMDYPRFVMPAVLKSYGERTYVWKYGGRDIVVWKQKINGFQHLYGSALAAFELGNVVSDKLFCLNEFAEAFCDWNGIQADDQFDRKKDLWINRVGRRIGLSARRLGLSGRDADVYLQQQCMDTIENRAEFIPHWMDPRVAELNEAQLGCPFLPKRNVFNGIQKLVALAGSINGSSARRQAQVE